MSVFLVAIEASMYSVVVLAILCGVISTFYYIRIIKISYFEQKTSGNLYYPAERNTALIIALSFSFIVGFFVNPNVLYLYCYNISLFGLS